MNAFHYLVIVGALILALPVLLTPAGWVTAAVLIAIWLAVTVLGRWAAREYLDLKKQREAGMTTKKIQDSIGGTDDDHRRWRR
jgi:amino acid permease